MPDQLRRLKKAAPLTNVVRHSYYPPPHQLDALRLEVKNQRREATGAPIAAREQQLEAAAAELASYIPCP